MRFIWLLIVLSLGLLCLSPYTAMAQVDQTPYIPPSNIVELTYFQHDNVSYMNVSIAFPAIGYQVTDWGAVQVVGNTITVNATIYAPTGTVIPTITPISHVYNLGTLSMNGYVFTFEVWGEIVKTTNFQIPEYPASILLLALALLSVLVTTLHFKRTKKQRDIQQATY